MSGELKPCRRCGGHDDDLLMAPEDNESGDYVIGYWVICECGLSVHARGDCDKVIRKWNEWPVEDALRAENEELRAKWQSVPWKAIKAVLWHMPNGVPFAPYREIDEWRKANAPNQLHPQDVKESAE